MSLQSRNDRPVPQAFFSSLAALLLLVLGAGQSPASATAPPASPSGPLTDAQVYLPIVRTACPGIQGVVEHDGTPEANVTLDLRFFDGANWSTRMSTTSADYGSGRPPGSFLFTNVPSLAPGQRYYVRFVNGQGTGIISSNHLRFWATREVTNYVTGYCVDFGTFDTRNVEQKLPNPNQLVPLPYSFTWIARTAVPTDLYELDLYEPVEGGAFYATPLLTFMGSPAGYWHFTQLPPGFAFGVWYVWEVWVLSPDGGVGLSLHTKWFQFSDSGHQVAAPAAPAVWEAGWLEQRLAARRLPSQ